MNLTTIVYESSEAVEDAILAALHDRRTVVVDLDYIPTLRSDDIRSLIRLLRRSRDIGTEFALRATRADIRRTLSVTALDAVFTVVGHAA